MNQVTKQPHPLEVARNQMLTQREQFEASLPAHIPVERFMRIVMNAINTNPALLNCTRKSLWMSCQQAAEDGLLPDGRDGAIVPYKTRAERDGVIRVEGRAQWIPMYQGLLKKVRNSGELRDVFVGVVHDGDEFKRWNDEKGQHFTHVPLGQPSDENITHVYAVARTKDDGTYLDIMSRAEIDKVRAVARAAKGPWVDWYGEMAKKTVIRRLSKVLPMSTDLDDLIRRDDALYDLEGAKEETSAAAKAAGIQSATKTALDAFAEDEKTGIAAPSADESSSKGNSPPETASAENSTATTVYEAFRNEMLNPHDEKSIKKALIDFEERIEGLPDDSRDAAMKLYDERLAEIRAAS